MSSDLRPPFRPVRPPRPSSTGEAKGSLSSAKAQDPAAAPGAVRDSGTESLQPVVSTTASLEEKKERVCLEPIPPPGEKMQYRAIGLIEGQYIPSPEHFTRGILRTSDGLDLNAVLLGRVMSLVRKHLRPERNYLWVVYPRTRDKTEDLHVQLLGVWAPEEMGRTLPEGSRPDGGAGLVFHPGRGRFSIAGERVHHCQDPSIGQKSFCQLSLSASPEGWSRSPQAPSLQIAPDRIPAGQRGRQFLGSAGAPPRIPALCGGGHSHRPCAQNAAAPTPEAFTPPTPEGPTPSPRGQRPFPRDVYPPRDPTKVPKPVKRKRP